MYLFFHNGNKLGENVRLQPYHKLLTDTGLQFLSFCPVFCTENTVKCGFLAPFWELKNAKSQKASGGQTTGAFTAGTGAFGTILPWRGLNV